MQSILQNTKGDKVIWAVVIMLSLISLLAVYSSTQSLAFKQDKTAVFFLIKQLMVLGVGLVIIYYVHTINYNRFKGVALLLYIISLPLLAYTLIFGAKINEGSRWIRLPVINLTFQTSDMAKLALFLYLARVLSMKQRDIKDFKKGFLPVVLPVIATCGLIAPANLSTALMLGFTCCLLFFIGRVRVRHIAMLAVGGLFGLICLFFVSKLTGIGRASTWEQRIVNFTSAKKEADPRGDDYQALQGRMAIASGGVFGSGPGRGEAKDTLPHGYSDFIFANIIAEYGFVGGLVVVFLYLLFLWRAVIIFKRCPLAFGAFLAVALSITLVFQAMLNMAVNVGLVPVTGLTLPMISMGGSAIWFTSIAIGVVLSVSRYVEEETSKAKASAAVKPSAPADSSPTDFNPSNLGLA
jgi:cell division protein FtsW